MLKELSSIQIGKLIVNYVYFMLNALENLITASGMRLYQKETWLDREFHNVSICLLYLSIRYHSICDKFEYKVVHTSFY